MSGKKHIDDESTVILGVDPGLSITGYGVIKSENGEVWMVEAGVIKTNLADELGSRIHEIYGGIGSVIQEFKPDLIAVEELYAHYKHPKTAIIMGHARAMIFLQSAQSGVPIQSYAATKVKSALTGNGHATKEQMQAMIKARLGLKDVPRPADAADALAVALCHLHNAHQLSGAVYA